MSKSKWMSMAAVVAMTASLAVAAPHEGKGGGKHGRGRHGQFGARFAEKLNLTDAQKEQIKTLNQSFRESNKAFFEQTRDTRRQMREAREAGDQARLDALKATAQSQHAQMKQLREAQQQRVLSVLTAEQRAQFEAMKAERHARRGERRGHKQ
ncbi:MAG TPA: Spy/CpxP family protein refolding chaperone [Thermoanaerobaculia bacterium]|nr:Spy/CpxP family protein refolding chaperone [Thermoanaerobaculia bacterium]